MSGQICGGGDFLKIIDKYIASGKNGPHTYTPGRQVVMYGRNANPPSRKGVQVCPTDTNIS